jgi:hypothetical protein
VDEHTSFVSSMVEEADAEADVAPRSLAGANNTKGLVARCTPLLSFNPRHPRGRIEPMLPIAPAIAAVFTLPPFPPSFISLFLSFSF